MSNKDKYAKAMLPSTNDQIPRLSQKCGGQLYTVKANDTLFLISRKFGVKVEEILSVNPQIVNRDVIFIGQVICIPLSTTTPCCDLRVLTLNILTEEGQSLPVVDGAVQLSERVILRPTFNRPVSRVFFFLEPTGTGTCELASLIDIDCPSAVTGVAEILWQVPSGTLGRVFVVACINSCCAKSEDVLVVRNS
ncbi:MAG: LysM peptidoglycan-binding domain-containing protein [Peptococcales bacterium]